MIVAVSHPNDLHRNLESQTSEAISVHWFSEGPQLANRVDSVSSGALELHWVGNLQNSSSIRFGQLPPCQVLVLEIAKLSLVADEAVERLDEISRIVEAGFQQANSPTIVCLGHQLPSEYVARWMRMGMFSYVEASRDPNTIVRLLLEAKRHAASIREKFTRHQSLKQLWKSLTPDESSVLDMIFDGMPNKTIASRMDVSERTVEARRQRLFQKFATNSLPIVVQRVCEWKQLNEFFVSKKS